MSTDRIILPISPQTSIRSTQGAKIVFRIPEDCPKACGLPRRNKNSPLIKVRNMAKTHPDMWEALGGKDWKPRKKKKEIKYGCPHCLSQENLSRKRRLERYNDYKDDLRTLAKKARFEMPVAGMALYFYFPMPKSWSVKKKVILKGQYHLQKPDIDNLEKGFFDSLVITDEKVAQLSGHGKFWISDDEPGYIEILLNQPIYNPFNVELIDQEVIKMAPKRKWQRSRSKFTPPRKKPVPIRLIREDKIK